MAMLKFLLRKRLLVVSPTPTPPHRHDACPQPLKPSLFKQLKTLYQHEATAVFQSSTCINYKVSFWYDFDTCVRNSSKFWECYKMISIHKEFPLEKEIMSELKFLTSVVRREHILFIAEFVSLLDFRRLGPIPATHNISLSRCALDTERSLKHLEFPFHSQ